MASLCESCSNRIFPKSNVIAPGANVKCEEHHWTFQTNKCKQYLSNKDYAKFVNWQTAQCAKCKNKEEDCYKIRVNLFDFKNKNLDLKSDCTLSKEGP